MPCRITDLPGCIGLGNFTGVWLSGYSPKNSNNLAIRSLILFLSTNLEISLTTQDYLIKFIQYIRYRIIRSVQDDINRKH
jgi:hypothetical protein